MLSGKLLSSDLVRQENNEERGIALGYRAAFTCVHSVLLRLHLTVDSNTAGV